MRQRFIYATKVYGGDMIAINLDNVDTIEPGTTPDNRSATRVMFSNGDREVFIREPFGAFMRMIDPPPETGDLERMTSEAADDFMLRAGKARDDDAGSGQP